MLRFLDRLREEPEPARRRTALLIAFSMTGVIVIAWLMLVSSGSLYSYQQAPSAVASSSSPVAAARQALQESASMIKDFFAAVSQSNISFSATSSSATTSPR